MALILINTDTGELDRLAIAQAALVRAQGVYGAPNPPPAFLRTSVRWMEDTAEAQRRGWRRDHGLPDDSPTQMVNVPTWGASGESFASR